jgi:hypothetical protein
VVRLLALAGAVLLFVAGGWLGFIAVIAARRSEGVFVPAGYAAILCLAGAGFLARMAMRS